MVALFAGSPFRYERVDVCQNYRTLSFGKDAGPLRSRKSAVKHFHLSLGNQRDFLQKNKGVAENVSTYKSTEAMTEDN